MSIENNNNENNEAKPLTAEEQIDANFAKHLDIAIEAQDGPTEAKKPEAELNDDGTTKQPEDSSSDNSNAAAQPKPDKEGTTQQPQAHGAKDLKLNDGTVVRGGAERRFYEQRETARQEAAALRNDVERYKSEATSFKEKFELLENTTKNLHGADPEQLKIGINIVRDLQRDPAGTMKKLLAEVVAQGYTVEGIGAGIDTQAIQRMIDERLPKQDTNAANNDDADIEKEVSTFFSQHPDAQPHDALLARVLRDNPGMELRTAYFQMKNAFSERGFDWSLPLEKNLENEQSSLANQQGNPAPKLPLPNGSNVDTGSVVVNKENLAHESEDTGDIIRAAMREAGMKVD